MRASRKKLSWHFGRDRVSRARGLGVWYEYGSTGTTYGEDGRNMFLFLHLLVGVEFRLNFGWKDYR